MKVYFYERLDSDDCFEKVSDFTENYWINFFSFCKSILKIIFIIYGIYNL